MIVASNLSTFALSASKMPQLRGLHGGDRERRHVSSLASSERHGEGPCPVGCFLPEAQTRRAPGELSALDLWYRAQVRQAATLPQWG